MKRFRTHAFSGPQKLSCFFTVKFNKFLSLLFISLVSSSFSLAQLTYQQVLELGQQSPRLVLAEQQLELSQRQLDVAASVVKADLSAGYTHSWGTLTAPEGVSPINEGKWDPFALNVNFLVVPFGPGHDQTIRAGWEVERSQQALTDERAATFLDISQRFGSASETKLELALAQRKLEYVTQSLQEIETRLAAGAATETEHDQAEVAVLQAQSAVHSLEGALRQALAGLSQSLGSSVEDIQGDLPESTVAPADPKTQVMGRTDVKEATLALQDAELSNLSTLRERLPNAALKVSYDVNPEKGQYSVGARYDTTSFQPSAFISLDPDFQDPKAIAGQLSRSVSVGISVVVPLDIANSDALEAGHLAVAQRQLQLQGVVEGALLEVQLKQLNVSDAATTVALAQTNLEQAKSALEVAHKRFEAGIISNLEVFQADLEVQRLDLELVKAQHALTLAHLELAIALAINPAEVY
jgi:outer membrane protein